MKISNIRPKHVPEDQKASYMEDVNRYLKQISNFTDRQCPGCKSSNSEKFAKHLEFQFVRCLTCFSVYMSPGPTQEMVNDLYRDSSNYAYWSEHTYPNTRDSRRLTLHKNRAEFVINSMEKYGNKQEKLKVLEIGAGTGDSLAVLRELISQEIETWALEPNESMQEALKANNIKIWNGRSCNSFDLVLGFEVIEHFLNPTDFFEIGLKALKGGGNLILTTPNAQSIEVQLLRDKSTTLDIEHISVLTPTAINLLAISNGFNVNEITTPGSFDLELLAVEYGEILDSLDSTFGNLQTALAQSGFSSHMRSVLTLNT